MLEAEHRRLRRWIPRPGAETIEVSLFPLADFLTAFSGSIDVLGIYDGRVRVPFADLGSLHPYLVSILSHEVAHAMIDGQTAGRAPAWVQEGLAQHVEMVQHQINPVPDLDARGRLMALPVVDAAPDGFSDPELVELAYAQAAWTVHYVEARHGTAGIHRLLDAFAAGADSEQAVERALGQPLAGFDLAMRRWCLDEAPATWPTEVVRYDQELASPLSRGERARAAPETREEPRWATRPQAAMEEWHRGYSARAAAVRSALGPVIGALRGGGGGGGGGGDLAPACARLEGLAAGLLADPAAFASPDRAPGEALRAAFDGFRRTASSCRAGEVATARRELDAAERHLGRAAELLRPYRLRP